jgi:hypothetical protein
LALGNYDRAIEYLRQAVAEGWRLIEDVLSYANGTEHMNSYPPFARYTDDLRAERARLKRLYVDVR